MGKRNVVITLPDINRKWASLGIAIDNVIICETNTFKVEIVNLSTFETGG